MVFNYYEHFLNKLGYFHIPHNSKKYLLPCPSLAKMVLLRPIFRKKRKQRKRKISILKRKSLVRKTFSMGRNKNFSRRKFLSASF